MTLADHQRAIARYCLDPAGDPEAVRDLGGDPARWALYRSMVRRRFVETVGDALPRTRAVLGAAALESAVGSFLSTSPPTTRYVREIGLRFADHLLSPGALPRDAVAHLADLVRYERARLEVACALDDPAYPVAEFAMDRPAAFAPAHGLVRAGWDVHHEAPAVGHRAGSFPLLVYRDPVTHRVDALELSPIAGDLVEAMAAGDRTVTDCVVGVLAQHRAAAGEVFLASFADLLGDLLDRGVLRGARAD